MMHKGFFLVLPINYFSELLISIQKRYISSAIYIISKDILNLVLPKPGLLAVLIPPGSP